MCNTILLNTSMILPEFGRLQAPHILDITLKDTHVIQKALAIYDQSLGQDYITPDDFIKYIKNKEKYIVIGATLQNNLVGVMVAYTMGIEETQEYNDILRKHKGPLTLESYKVGVIKSVAVEKQHRHRGIGTQLTRESIRSLQMKECNALFAISWVSNKPYSSQPMFESLGFRNILTIPNYWTEDSIKEGYLCPNCGNPCRCAAIFYFKLID